MADETTTVRTELELTTDARRQLGTGLALARRETKRADFHGDLEADDDPVTVAEINDLIRRLNTQDTVHVDARDLTVAYDALATHRISDRTDVSAGLERAEGAVIHAEEKLAELEAQQIATDGGQTVTDDAADLEEGDRVTVDYETTHGNDAEITGVVTEVRPLSSGYGDAFVDADDGREYMLFGAGGDLEVKSLASGSGVTVGYGAEVTVQEPQTDGGSDKAIHPTEVDFDAYSVAREWEENDDLTVRVAAAITHEFTDHVVLRSGGVQSDRDVVFESAGVLVEEKAVGVCPRDVAEEYAPAYVDLDRPDGKVLAVNPAQVMEYSPPPMPDGGDGNDGNDGNDGDDFDADEYQREHVDAIRDLLETTFTASHNRYDDVKAKFVPRQGVESFKIPFSGKYVFERVHRELEALGFEVVATIIQAPDQAELNDDQRIDWVVTQVYEVRATEPVLDDHDQDADETDDDTELVTDGGVDRDDLDGVDVDDVAPGDEVLAPIPGEGQAVAEIETVDRSAAQVTVAHPVTGEPVLVDAIDLAPAHDPAHDVEIPDDWRSGAKLGGELADAYGAVSFRQGKGDRFTVDVDGMVSAGVTELAAKHGFRVSWIHPDDGGLTLGFERIDDHATNRWRHD